MTEQKRDFVYAEQAQTSIFLEQASEKNPYVSKANFLQGYNILELMQKKSFTEVLLLLFTGKLPSAKNAALLEKLQIGLMNLGPRHPAIKSAMVAGVSKTNVEHLLPIGLSVLGGELNGAKEVQQSMGFLQENVNLSATAVADKLIADLPNSPSQGEFHLCPGFGNQYGSIDEFTVDLAEQIYESLSDITACQYLIWAKEFSLVLQTHNMGCLKTGLAAAVFCQLGLTNRQGVGLYQIICAPGIFAHGVEQMHKPITAIPMLSDEQHIYTPKP